MVNFLSLVAPFALIRSKTALNMFFTVWKSYSSMKNNLEKELNFTLVWIPEKCSRIKWKMFYYLCLKHLITIRLNGDRLKVANTGFYLNFNGFSNISQFFISFVDRFIVRFKWFYSLLLPRVTLRCSFFWREKKDQLTLGPFDNDSVAHLPSAGIKPQKIYSEYAVMVVFIQWEVSRRESKSSHIIEIKFYSVSQPKSFKRNSKLSIKSCRIQRWRERVLATVSK